MTTRVIALLCGASSLLFATNGTNLIATTTVQRAMGGTGIAYGVHATDAMHKNIALINDVNSSEFSFDLTYFNANVVSSVYDKMPLNANLTPLPNLPSYDAATEATSQNHIETNFIPALSYVWRHDDQLSFGVAMLGAAGMGADYKGEYSQRQLKSAMMLMKIIPAISYRQGNTTFAFAPVVGLGSMSLNYDEAYLDENGNSYPYGTKPQSNREGLFGTNVGGSSLVPAIGYQVGMDVQVTPAFRIGATFNSSLKYTYKEVANFSQFGPSGMVYMADEWLRNNQGFGLNNTQGLSEQLQAGGMDTLLADAIEALAGTSTIQGALDDTNPKNLDDLTLEQPWELGLGFSYQFSERGTVAFDYRYIAWGLSEGYRDFGWENQQVFAIGFDFDLDAFNLRFGYNYAESPIKNESDETGALLTDVQGHLVFDQAISMLNMVGFPAISTTHFSFGVGYAISDAMTLETAMVYAPEVTTTRSGSLSPLTTGFDTIDMSYEYKTSMRQFSLSAGLNYLF